jgi:hypothetical protein
MTLTSDIAENRLRAAEAIMTPEQLAFMQDKLRDCGGASGDGPLRFARGEHNWDNFTEAMGVWRDAKLEILQRPLFGEPGYQDRR